ncbi:MAG: TnsD family Tn7-like transposition protein [Pseudorhodoferax sp.]
MQQPDLLIGKRLPWLPDETLFSWCSRYHVLSSNGLASATCMQLFGRRRDGTAHDFPAGLGALAERSAGSIGTVNALVDERTLLPFYGPFRPADLYERATQSMQGDGIGSLKFRLGLLTSGLGAAHPLKACSACMDEDRRQYAVAYWRRTHQWPAVWTCPTHGDPLLISPIKLDQRARFQFALPAQAGLVGWWDGSDYGRTLKPLQTLAAFAVDLCVLAPGRLTNVGAIAQAVLEGMRCRCWLSASGRVAWQKFEGVLHEHAAAVAGLPPFAMQMDVRAAQAQLSRLVAARSLTQPLRYLAWLSLIFDDLATFIGHYDRFLGAADPPVPAPERCLPAARPQGMLSPHAVSSLQAGLESATAIARRQSVHPSTIAAWAAKAGVETPRRPKVVDDKKRAVAIKDLLEGQDKAVVAAKLGVSEVTITRVLRQVPGLQARWHQVREHRARERARAAWTVVASAAPLLGVAAARRAEPAAYAWLYRNDREWLRQSSSSFGIVPRDVNYVSARRERADERYARALHAAAAARAAPSDLDLLNPEHWALLAPGLRRVLRRPQGWPRTISVLRVMLEARKCSELQGLF